MNDPSWVPAAQKPPAKTILDILALLKPVNHTPHIVENVVEVRPWPGYPAAGDESASVESGC
ncbi:hypothetical protein ACOZ38_25595 [Sphaerisporangium viridialbum]|uniref:hypothetical protein n=1 Tax=Sphaerisporangium viridialbum TaxID=46189 RepID=UPI003C74B153